MAKAKVKPTEVHPQTLLKGQVIRSTISKTDEVIRSVSVVVHLANGMDEVYNDGDIAKVVPVDPVDFPEELTAKEK